MKIEPKFDDLKGWYSLILAELPLAKEIQELKFDENWHMREFLEKVFKKKKAALRAATFVTAPARYGSVTQKSRSSRSRLF